MTRASTTRLEAFSDGVFAIAITLLIFGIRVPVIVGPEISEELKRQLLSLWLIGIFWIAHHHMFRLIALSTRPLLWLNTAFLMCGSFLPFPTAILGLYGKQRISVILYCATLMIAAVALYILWIYASLVEKLLYSGVPPRVVRVVGRRILGGCLLYGVALGLSFVSLTASRVLVALIPFLYFMPSSAARYIEGDSSLT